MRTIALIPIARTTFDIPFASEIFQRTQTALSQAGFVLSGPSELVTDSSKVQEIIHQMDKTPHDLIILLYCSFADSDLAKQIVSETAGPILLWAVPEEPGGGRLRLNSLCGINLTGHSLHRGGYTYDYLYTLPEDSAAIEKIRVLANAGYAIRTLKGTKIGKFGHHPNGFDSCIPNQTGLENVFGLELVQIELDTLFNRVRKISDHSIDPLREDLNHKLDGLNDLDQASLNGTLKTYQVMQEFSQEENLKGLAVRCWPEFFTDLGCAACGAMSLMTDQRIPCSCEADLNGTVTQLILQTLSGEPAFGTDLVHMDMEKDTAVFWHCGLAPLSMADPKVKPRGIVHTNRKLPLLMEFTLKPGGVTIARLSEANRDFQLVFGKANMLESEKQFSGTSGVVRFENSARKVLDTIISNGLEHHFSLTYGNFTAELATIARYLKIPTLEL
ncbi:MAG: L-fucose/L-arabinose isomerase family protein [Anaerolineaceae bacterium]|nr:L-fucose/L-arabinose isomerase family protein [Anaerolineaceae bacterium]